MTRPRTCPRALVEAMALCSALCLVRHRAVSTQLWKSYITVVHSGVHGVVREGTHKDTELGGEDPLAHPAHITLGIEPRVLRVSGKCPLTELHLPPRKVGALGLGHRVAGRAPVTQDSLGYQRLKHSVSG